MADLPAVPQSLSQPDGVADANAYEGLAKGGSQRDPARGSGGVPGGGVPGGVDAGELEVSGASVGPAVH